MNQGQKKFRKYIIVFLLASACVLFSAPAYAADIAVMVNGERLTLDVAPQIQSGRTLVPMRAIAEKLGATVQYESSAKKITITKDGDTVILYLNKSTATINGTARTLDVPAQAISGRTLVPLRFVGESLRATVEWVASNRTVVVTTSGTSGGSTTGKSLETIADELLSYINDKREQLGLEPLILVEPLTQMALSHSTDMALNGFFSHDSPNLGSIEVRAKGFGLNNIAENIAYGYPDAKSVFDAWMNSADHRQNMLSADAQFIGLGVYHKTVNSLDDICFTADFIWGDGFMVTDRSKKSATTLNLKGYVATNDVPLTIYTMKSDGATYSSRKVINLSPDSSDGAFTKTISLADGNLYYLYLGNDKLVIDNR